MLVRITTILVYNTAIQFPRGGDTHGMDDGRNVACDAGMGACSHPHRRRLGGHSDLGPAETEVTRSKSRW